MRARALLFLCSALAFCESTDHFPSEKNPEEEYVRLLFQKYGISENKLTFEGFEHLLSNLRLGSIQIQDHVVSQHFVNGTFVENHGNHSHRPQNTHHSHNHRHRRDAGHRRKEERPFLQPDDSIEDFNFNFSVHSEEIYVQCLTAERTLSLFGVEEADSINIQEFQRICPAIVYQIDEHSCKDENILLPKQWSISFIELPPKVWLWSVGSILLISVVGLICVVLIPLIKGRFYQQVLHVLVALAVGSLSGDALLHLLPHAILLIMYGAEHQHRSGLSIKNMGGVYLGLVAIGAIVFFHIMESLLSIILKQRKRKRTKKEINQNDKTLQGNPIEFKYSSDTEECETGEDPQLRLTDSHDDHGHSHEVPDGISSLAWMVILGDGMHNFSDGMAIGAAFASSITTGISTTLAVFCHELPHELGDFALLLQTGMSVRRALFYNILSSVLSVLGMFIGIIVANIEAASAWIFAFVAGSFLYIALFDMLPELKKSGNRVCGWKRSLGMLLLQLSGLLTGITVMLLIALFESEISLSLDL